MLQRSLHGIGLVSEYDDQFVEKFVQTFERELAAAGSEESEERKLE